MIGYFAICLVAGAPLISVMIAGSIASWNGCTLHEGFVNPCVINGRDIGETLYAMGVMGWFMLVTIPLGALAFIAWTLTWVWWTWRRQQAIRTS